MPTVQYLEYPKCLPSISWFFRVLRISGWLLSVVTFLFLRELTLLFLSTMTKRYANKSQMIFFSVHSFSGHFYQLLLHNFKYSVNWGETNLNYRHYSHHFNKCPYHIQLYYFYHDTKFVLVSLGSCGLHELRWGPCVTDAFVSPSLSLLFSQSVNLLNDSSSWPFLVRHFLYINGRSFMYK